MIRKIKFMFFIGLFMTSTVMAAVQYELRCSNTDKTFRGLYEGLVKSGAEYTIVYSPGEEAFYHLKTKSPRLWSGDLATGSPSYEIAGYEDYMGEERPYYRLTKSTKAYAYKGPRCPICNNGTIEMKRTGYVD
jgi:hypothetical protein